MKRSKEKLSAQEILDLLNLQWADTETVMKLGSIGSNKALYVKKVIRESLENEGYFLPRGLIPMDKLVDYFKINVSYLKKISGKEKKWKKKLKHICH